MNRILDIYYRLRRRLGMEEITAERIRRQVLLHPAEDAAGALMEEDRMRLKQVLFCLAGAAVLTVLVLMQNRTSLFTDLTRPGYGEASEEVVLDLTVDDREYEIPVTLDSQTYTEEELPEKLDEAWKAAEAQALGENRDWQHVSQNLDFSEETGIPGITVSWSSGDVNVISADGSVVEPDDEDTVLPVELTATLFYESEEQTHTVEASVVFPEMSEVRKAERKLSSLLEQALADREKEVVELPGAIDGSAIIYRDKDSGMPLWLIPALGILAAAMLWMLPGQRTKEAMTERNRELALAYSELVWKLTVLMGAGMTVRGAWEQILRSAYGKPEEGSPGILYEEMRMTWNAMNQGVYEEKAYAEFGRRCGLQPYLRLGSLLETNVRQGRKGLAEQMQSEADAAFRERLQLAKRQGEEASSKLLMPMMLLFALVLVILMVPALSAFA